MVGGGSLEPSLLPSLNPPGVPTPGGGCSGSSKVQRPPVSHTPAHFTPQSALGCQDSPAARPGACLMPVLPLPAV